MTAPHRNTNRLPWEGFAGIFLISLSTLMLEVLLTRIFSVTMWYHFAFVAISLAMLGLSAGAILVHVFPAFFSQQKAPFHLALFSILFPVAIALSLVIHLALRYSPGDPPLVINTFRVITLTVISVPFTLSGIVICLTLTKFPIQVSRLYAADLSGAALGCVLIVALLDSIGDVFSVIAVIGALCGLASVLFALTARSKRLLAAGSLCTFVFFALAGLMAVRFNTGQPLVRMTWAKGHVEEEALHERWNSYSRIKITRNPADRSLLLLRIDATASTTLRRFDGDLASQRSLTNQMAAVVHFLRPQASVAIIGLGGGVDMLTAHVFGQNPVIGIEMNKDTVEALTGKFGDFTGHLDQLPGFRIINDEARSYLARSDEKFDIIMANMIDTWAATAAGAFVLSENSLYTVEAWRTFIQHLKPRGILGFTRWYRGKIPGEMYRVMSLAVAALKAEGVDEPLQHIAILKERWQRSRGTIIVAREPLTETDIRKLEGLQEGRPYELVLSPRRSSDPVFEEIAVTGTSREFLDRFPLDISPPTDDRPFFFNMLNFREIYAGGIPALRRASQAGANQQAVFVLGVLMIAVTVMTISLVFLPLLLTRRKVNFSGATPLLVYFGSIGLAFILVEISQLQRLIIFLGHPTYSLSVVLLSLLLSSGMGSFFTSGIDEASLLKTSLRRMGILLLVLCLFGILTPNWLQGLRGAGMPLRITVSVLILFPMGFLMGMAFPLGMKFASRRWESLTPWLWGVNGAASVFSSVLAVVISLGSGISTTFWVGSACYLVAAVSLLLIDGKSTERSPV